MNAPFVTVVERKSKAKSKSRRARARRKKREQREGTQNALLTTTRQKPLSWSSFRSRTMSLGQIFDENAYSGSEKEDNSSRSKITDSSSLQKDKVGLNTSSSGHLTNSESIDSFPLSSSTPHSKIVDPVDERGEECDLRNWTLASIFSKNPPPSGRFLHASCCTMNSLFVVGGKENASTGGSDFFRFSFKNQAWQRLRIESPVWDGQRIGHSLFSIGNERKIYILFGVNADKQFCNDLLSYDVETGLLSRIAVGGDIPPPRSMHSTVVLQDRYVFIHGGMTKSEKTNEHKYLSDTYVLDLETLRWGHVLTSECSARGGHGACMVPFRQSNGYMSQYMIVYGGYCNGKQSNHLAILDIGVGRWLIPIATGSPPPKDSCANLFYLPESNEVVTFSRGFFYAFNLETSKWIKLDIFGPTEMIFPFHSVCSYMSNVSNNCQQPSADSLSPNTTNANASFCFFGGLDGGVAHTSFLILQTTNVELNSESENSENDSPYIPVSKIDQDDDFVSSPRDLDKSSYSDAESEYYSGSGSSSDSECLTDQFDGDGVDIVESEVMVTYDEIEIFTEYLDIRRKLLVPRERVEHLSSLVNELDAHCNFHVGKVKYCSRDAWFDLVTQSDLRTALSEADRNVAVSAYIPILRLLIEPADSEGSPPSPGLSSVLTDRTRSIKDFEILETLGSGNGGIVYRAVETNTGLHFAVKKILIPRSTGGAPPVDCKIALIHKEIDLMKSFDHKNIVKYLGVQHDDDTVFIFMEFVANGSLAHEIQTLRVLQPSLIAVYMREILHGLKYLHDRDILHRDIKPANILIDLNGNAKLTDFGCSRQLAGISISVNLVGTPYYMAPEVIKDQQYSYAADIWSVGATCLEMATGIPPWFSLENPNEHHLAALFRIGSSTVPPTIPEGLPDDLKHFISSCLRIPPNERPSCSELLHHSFLHRRSTALRGDSLSSLQSKASSVGPKTHFKTSFGSPDEALSSSSKQASVRLSEPSVDHHKLAYSLNPDNSYRRTNRRTDESDHTTKSKSTSIGWTSSKGSTAINLEQSIVVARRYSSSSTSSQSHSSSAPNSDDPST